MDGRRTNDAKHAEAALDISIGSTAMASCNGGKGNLNGGHFGADHTRSGWAKLDSG